MTIARLIKELQKVQEKVGPRTEVCAAAQRLLDKSNGVFQIASLEKVEVKVVNVGDGDGFLLHNKDGTERQRTTVILS